MFYSFPSKTLFIYLFICDSSTKTTLTLIFCQNLTYYISIDLSFFGGGTSEGFTSIASKASKLQPFEGFLLKNLYGIFMFKKNAVEFNFLSYGT